jgi:hypothetical protein
MKRIFLVLGLIIFIGCGTTNQLSRYKGKGIEAVIKNFGDPTSIIPVSGGSIYIFEQSTKLRSAEISKGQTTLDPMVSPATTKTEKNTFTVINGKVVKATKEIGYSRR